MQKSINMSTLLASIIIIDLVIGGSGNLIKWGSVSFRMVLLALAIIFEVFMTIKGSIKITKVDLTIMLFLFYLIVNSMIGVVFGNDFNEAVKNLRGFAPLLMCPFFGYVFRNHEDYLITASKVFRVFTLINSILVVALWIYCFRTGTASYSVIEIGFLRKYSMGSLSFIGSYPRVFLKTTVFIGISFGMELYEMIDCKKSIKKLIVIIVEAMAVLLSFTLGIILFTGIITMIVLFQKGIVYSKKKVKTIAISIILLIAVLVIIAQTSVLDIFIDRFSGELSGGYTLGMRQTQIVELMKQFVLHPFFGAGLGHMTSIDYGYQLRESSNAEVMWVGLLNNIGLLGVSLYLFAIIPVCKLLRNNGEKLAYFWYIGLLFLSLESFTNPFMNNTIGTTYFAICVGVYTKYALQSTSYIKDI